MGMGGGGGGSQSNTGSGSGWTAGFGSSDPILYDYKSLMTPWQKSGQQQTLPMLMQRAFSGGMSPDEERNLLGTVRQQTDQEFDQQRAGLGAKAVASGLSSSSPVVIGERGNLGAAQIAARTNAALNFAKLKAGAGDSARSQLLSALYSQTPYAIGNQSHYENQSANQQSSYGTTEQGGSK